MSVSRRAPLFVLAVSFGAAGVLAIACSTFGAGDEGVPAAEAAPADSSGDGAEAGDGGDAGSVRFCETAPATAIICDDFEANGGSLLSTWKQDGDAGLIAAAPAPMRAGHAVKFTQTGAGQNLSLVFPFSAVSAVAGLRFDVDLLIDTPGYDYIQVCDLHLAGLTDTYFGGVSKGGTILGRVFTPQSGPTIPLDGAWHHLHVELVQVADAGDAASRFRQTVTLDTTELDRTTKDLSAMSNAGVELGVIAPSLPAQPLAIIYFDNVLVRSP